jgi:putative membrane protein
LRLLLRWVINTVVIVGILYVLNPHIAVNSVLAGIIVGLVLGFLNAGMRPAFVLLSLPLNVVTLGVSVLVVNGVTLEILSWVLGDRFDIDGLLWLVVSVVIISLLTTIVNIAVGVEDPKAKGSRR